MFVNYNFLLLVYEDVFLYAYAALNNIFMLKASHFIASPEAGCIWPTNLLMFSALKYETQDQVCSFYFFKLFF